MPRDRLPPGQSLTRKFPVVGETAPDRALTPEAWRLTVGGLVARPLTLSFADFARRADRTLTIDIHCVTSRSRFDTTFTGMPLAELLDEADVHGDAAYVRFAAYSTRGHDTSLSLDAARDAAWVVHAADGAPLSVEHGGPVRLVTPGRYFYKSLKWLRAIELRADDALGYWERESAYHNHGDPWREERFDDTRMTPAETVAAFRALSDFDAWRGGGADTVVLRGRFANWTPRTTDLRGLQLKACDFRNADLRGAVFDDANLTLGRFLGADLRGARFVGTDLEGADFVGADLSGASMERVRLSATAFVKTTPGGARRSATVAGLVVRDAHGLLEDQAVFLREAGVAVTGS